MNIKNFLANSQMVRVVANFLKKEPAVDDQGKITLSTEEEQRLTQHFGTKFVEVLKSKTFKNAEDSATDLYEAAVAHVREEVEGQFTGTIKQLQNDLATLAAQPEVLPVAEKALGAVAGIAARQKSTFKADMSLAHNRAAGVFLQSGVMTGTPTIEVGDLRKELGPYLSQGNNLDILQQVYQSFSTSKHLTWKRAVTEYKAALAQSVDHVVQQFKPQWTPRGGVKFEPLTIKNYRHKVNFPVIPAEVGESWLFYLYDEGLSPDQMPITRYVVDKVMLPQIAEDIENVMISKAKFVENSEKTEDAMDGFETILVDAKKSRNKHFRFFKNDKNLLEATDDEGTAGAGQDANQGADPTGDLLSVNHLEKIRREKAFKTSKLDIFGTFDDEKSFRRVYEYIAEGRTNDLSANERLFLDLLTIINSFDRQFGKRATIKFLTQQLGYSYDRAVDYYNQADGLFYSNRNTTKEALRNKYAELLEDLAHAAKNAATTPKDYEAVSEIVAKAAKIRKLDEPEIQKLPAETYLRQVRVFSLTPEVLGLPSINRQEVSDQIQQLHIPEVEKSHLRREALIEDVNIIELLENGKSREN